MGTSILGNLYITISIIESLGFHHSTVDLQWLQPRLWVPLTVRVFGALRKDAQQGVTHSAQAEQDQAQQPTEPR